MVFITLPRNLLPSSTSRDQCNYVSSVQREKPCFILLTMRFTSRSQQTRASFQLRGRAAVSQTSVSDLGTMRDPGALPGREPFSSPRCLHTGWKWEKVQADTRVNGEAHQALLT